MAEHTRLQRAAAEFVGTFLLVFLGCGSAVLAAGFLSPDKVHLGIGFVGVAVTFGATVTVSAYTMGAISGGHFNPAVTFGLAVARRFPWRDTPLYITTQLAAASTASLTLFLIASGRPGFDATSTGFATNGYGARSPGGYHLTAALITETLTTAIFVLIILAATDDSARPSTAPLTIGLTLTVIHLVTIPLTNTSVNPARSIGPALFAGSAAITQLWVFITAPLLGAAIAAITYTNIFATPPRVTTSHRPNTRQRPTTPHRRP